MKGTFVLQKPARQYGLRMARTKCRPTGSKMADQKYSSERVTVKTALTMR